MKKKPSFFKSTRIILSICLPILTLSLVTLLIAYLIERESAPVSATIYYRGALEYIFASLAIIIGGSLLSEVVNTERI